MKEYKVKRHYEAKHDAYKAYTGSGTERGSLWQPAQRSQRNAASATQPAQRSQRNAASATSSTIIHVAGLGPPEAQVMLIGRYCIVTGLGLAKDKIRRPGSPSLVGLLKGLAAPRLTKHSR